MNEQSGNWWQFYGVRYAQGAVVGAMLIFLLFSQNETLKKILFMPEKPEDFGIPHLILLAVYGLVYCYIASAPVLIMHAGRGLLFRSFINPDPYKGWLKRSLCVFTPALVAAGICSFLTDFDFLKSAAAGLFVFLVAFQFTMLYIIFHGAWFKIIDYYQVIIKKRSDQNNKEFVESYKHIREHGNAFLIVLFQFLLAVPIFAFVSLANNPIDVIRGLITLVVVWVLPASFIWMFGNKLENHMQSL